MNEYQRAAVDSLLAGLSDGEADRMMGCLWRGLESLKRETREDLARAVLTGEIGSVGSYRRRLLDLDDFDQALTQHPYAVRRDAEIKKEEAGQRENDSVRVLGALLGLRGRG